LGPLQRFNASTVHATEGQMLNAFAQLVRRGENFRSLDATPFPFAPELKPLACVGSSALLGRMTAFTLIENGRQL
jgi:hypothetical protein